MKVNLVLQAEIWSCHSCDTDEVLHTDTEYVAIEKWARDNGHNIQSVTGLDDEDEPKFKRMLDLSTAHVTKQTADFLDNMDGDAEQDSREAKLEELLNPILPVRWVKHRYGWVFWPTEPDEDQNWENAPELESINRFAYESGCMLVNFDGDADTNERFTTYKW